jgi:hypothetical protein
MPYKENLLAIIKAETGINRENYRITADFLQTGPKVHTQVSQERRFRDIVGLLIEAPPQTPEQHLKFLRALMDLEFESSYEERAGRFNNKPYYRRELIPRLIMETISGIRDELDREKMKVYLGIEKDKMCHLIITLEVRGGNYLQHRNSSPGGIDERGIWDLLILMRIIGSDRRGLNKLKQNRMFAYNLVHLNDYCSGLLSGLIQQLTLAGSSQGGGVEESQISSDLVGQASLQGDDVLDYDPTPPPPFGIEKLPEMFPGYDLTKLLVVRKLYKDFTDRYSSAGLSIETRATNLRLQHEHSYIAETCLTRFLGSTDQVVDFKKILRYSCTSKDFPLYLGRLCKDLLEDPATLEAILNEEEAIINKEDEARLTQINGPVPSYSSACS